MSQSPEKAGADAGRAQSIQRVQKGFLLFVVATITVLFLVMVRQFLVAVIMAGVFAGMSRRPFMAITGWMGGRERLAALVTVLGMLVLIVVPTGGFLALVLSQAVDVAEAAGPWLRDQAGQWAALIDRIQQIPLVGPLIPGQGAILSGLQNFAGRAGSFLVNNLSAATTGTVALVLQLFVTLYAMYFFLRDGPSILSRILYFTPLDDASERKLVGRFVSVTRATIKGSILVGLIQGALAGSAFFVLGLPGAAFWSTVMAVLSVIPVLGSGIVWAPAVVILISTGRMAEGLGLAIWGLVVVGLADNFLRPKFVGRDTKMHDLLVLLSTFGGLAMFGIVGFIIGPIVAALFLTAWDLVGAAFEDFLPEEGPGLPVPPVREAGGGGGVPVADAG